jgi:CRP/FNR family cyclic AMP-dependent transcriptional regulator
MKFDFHGDVQDFLQINPWFAGLPDVVQAALVEAGRRTTLAKGQWLYAEGDASSGLSAVLTGSLRVAVSVGPERDVLFDIAGPGAILGHPVGLAGRPRLSTARAGARSQVFAVPYAQVQTIGAAHPMLLRALDELYHYQVGYILLIAAGALSLAPRARVAGRLLLIAQNRLDQTDFVPVTQADLAEMTGLSRKSAHGHLQALRRMRIVEVVYGGVRILDQARLLTLAEQ